MDDKFRRLPDCTINRLELENGIIFSTLQHDLGTNTPALDSDPELDYISQILLEEDSIGWDNNDNMFFDPITLSAAESSFYEALTGNTSSPFHSNSGSSDITFGSSSDDVDHIESKPVVSKSSVACDPPELATRSSSSQTSSFDELNGSLCSLDSLDSVPDIFCDEHTESILKLPRGVREAGKCPLPPEARGAIVNIEKDRSDESCRGKKHHHPDESGLEDERKSKHSAVYEEIELSEVFDKVLLCSDDNEASSKSSRVGRTQHKGQSARKSHSKKRGDSCEILDLESLLISCAESVSSASYRAAEDELKKIRKHSSPNGDANQRLANLFADSLEARLAGTGMQLNAAFSPNNTTVSEFQKFYLSSLPFMRVSLFFANNMICEVASKCASLHIIDFGILYGVQWPTLIRDLSQRFGGPPKLRITGVELPQPGFRPSQMVEETGFRLAKYCERFGLPFEYNSITAKNWETLKTDDFKLVNDEVVAVNCSGRFDDLLDETAVVGDNPKDALLNLIREINPHIFVPSQRSGALSSPFFPTRFREALLYYSTAFDMYDAALPSHGHERSIMEKEIMGRDIMNIIACEGMERHLRPETYRQWHSRILRAGFSPVPINSKVMKKTKKYIRKARVEYHKDFLYMEDGHWILQGWKGRILTCISCWTSAQQIQSL
ncbi:unnamed protein product [Cuscuta europaea]|uniref:Uncharacterized protein n=1 Tax=Cuscuta europaea TaxID=41803 RepID=A0A9P0YPA2_CUSEU|nr:unnamed protein product [Cuscuta europaea]